MQLSDWQDFHEQAERKKKDKRKADGDKKKKDDKRKADGDKKKKNDKRKTDDDKKKKDDKRKTDDAPQTMDLGQLLRSQKVHRRSIHVIEEDEAFFCRRHPRPPPGDRPRAAHPS